MPLTEVRKAAWERRRAKPAELTNQIVKSVDAPIGAQPAAEAAT